MITRPMDLRTMINKIKQRVYDTPEEVRSDAYLIIANCKEYNEEGSEIYDVSGCLNVYFYFPINFNHFLKFSAQRGSRISSKVGFERSLRIKRRGGNVEPLPPYLIANFLFSEKFYQVCGKTYPVITLQFIVNAKELLNIELTGHFNIF